MANEQIPQPRPAAEFAESVRLIRALVGVGMRQIEKAQVDLGVAIAGMAELEHELSTRGVAQ